MTTGILRFGERSMMLAPHKGDSGFRKMTDRTRAMLMDEYDKLDGR